MSLHTITTKGTPNMMPQRYSNAGTDIGDFDAVAWPSPAPTIFSIGATVRSPSRKLLTTEPKARTRRSIL